MIHLDVSFNESLGVLVGHRSVYGLPVVVGGRVLEAHGGEAVDLIVLWDGLR